MQVTKYRLNISDAVILAVAADARITTVYSEDLQDGFVLDAAPDGAESLPRLTELVLDCAEGRRCVARPL